MGVEKADELERLINLHGAENVAAVLVEPVSGAGGMIPPPIGYIQAAAGRSATGTMYCWY